MNGGKNMKAKKEGKKEKQTIRLGFFCLEQEGQNQRPLGTQARIGRRQKI